MNDICSYTQEHTSKGIWECIIPANEPHAVHSMRYRRYKPPCSIASPVGDIIGAPCKECGHTNVVHPNHGNPSVKVCLLCELEAVRNG